MQKKITLILLLFIIIPTIHAQSFKKRRLKSKEFLKKARAREVLDTMLWDKEAQIFNKTDSLFKVNKLDPKNPEDYEFYQSALMHQFLFSKRHIIKRVTYKYQHIDYDTLDIYIKQIDKGYLQKVIFNSGLYDLLNKLLEQEITQVEKRTIPKYIEFLVNKHKPVDLKIKYNNRLVKASNLNLDIVVETNNADYKRVSILDKKHSQIKKPKGYTYDQIQKIIVIYKGQEFEIKPDKMIQKYPKQFRELNSVMSKYSFDKIPVWDLEIIESHNNIGVKLSNVVEAKVVKGKSNRFNFKEQKAIDQK
ncbi:MAG TPA: hypothetical protein ENK64_02350 [Flavobacteriales bacterium]|jgi:hypothetical protein|nr:hypothetical protein [Flavobacteriales bacterium]